MTSPSVATRRVGLSRRVGGRRPSLSIAVGGGALLVIAIACLLVPMLSQYSPDDSVASPLIGPSWAHPFGTDSIGRDVFVRTFVGGRVDLAVVAICVISSAVIGTTIGVVAAYSSGWVDIVLMRIADAIVAFPFILLVLTIVLLFGTDTTFGPLPPGLPSLLIAIIATNWAVYARLARGQALSLKQRDFITAATVLGLPRRRVVFRHLMPNVATATGAYMVSDATLLVAVTASLPFLGAGIQPPASEWGVIMLGGSTVLSTAPWVTLLPGLVLSVTAISLSLVADALLARISGVAR
jgi:peptide/nickel transport system permease protein